MNIQTWHLLVASLPTAGATPRMRLWRAIKALGCAALRDGAYLLPNGEGHAEALAELAEQTNLEGGQAWVVDVMPKSIEDEAAFVSLFNRSADYAELEVRLRQARKELLSRTASANEKFVKRLRKELESLQHIDFFPGDASLACEAAWWELNDAANTLLSPDEPQQAERPIPRLDPINYRARTWATRRHLWVDRVASAWLIQRFIDQEAKFLWLENPAHCPKDALGFDFNDATFTHINDKVTFEVLLAAFGLEDDAGLSKIAMLVHALDVGGQITPEAAGFEAILSGARARLPDDDALLSEIGTVLDSLHTHFKQGNLL